MEKKKKKNNGHNRIHNCISGIKLYVYWLERAGLFAFAASKLWIAMDPQSNSAIECRKRWVYTLWCLRKMIKKNIYI